MVMCTGSLQDLEAVVLMAQHTVRDSGVEPVWMMGRDVYGSVCPASTGMPSQVSQGRGRKISLLAGVPSRTLQVALLGSTCHGSLLMLTWLGVLPRFQYDILRGTCRRDKEQMGNVRKPS